MEWPEKCSVQSGASCCLTFVIFEKELPSGGQACGSLLKACPDSVGSPGETAHLPLLSWHHKRVYSRLFCTLRWEMEA